MARINVIMEDEELELLKKAKGELSWHDYLMSTLKTPITKIMEDEVEVLVQPQKPERIDITDQSNGINYNTPISIGVFLAKIREAEPDFDSYHYGRNDIIRYYHELFPDEII